MDSMWQQHCNTSYLAIIFEGELLLSCKLAVIRNDGESIITISWCDCPSFFLLFVVVAVFYYIFILIAFLRILYLLSCLRSHKY